jgi:EAL domain-containing protein (putative c-di-GMP-specific phosphodiesterase class I)
VARPEQIRALHRLLDEELLEVVFQPIVDLKTRKVCAYEALARPADPIFETVLQMFEVAVEAGRVAELGRLHRRQAVRACRDWPLYLNLFPAEFDHGLLVRPDDPLFRHPRPVCIEVTESVPLTHFEQCHSVLAEVRKKGIRLAIDDLGAGYSNLKYISDLAPDVVKLDRRLVADLQAGSRQSRLLKSIVRLCQEMGAQVVVEGIETLLELALVEASGAEFGQGYLLARPGLPPPPAEWPESLC